MTTSAVVEGCSQIATQTRATTTLEAGRAVPRRTTVMERALCTTTCRMVPIGDGKGDVILTATLMVCLDFNFLGRQMMANLTTSQRADRDGFADDRSGWNDPYDFRDEFEDAQRPHERYYENERDPDRYDAAHERGRFEDQGEYPAWNNRRGPLMTKPSRR